jgi:hypothetical protein
VLAEGATHLKAVNVGRFGRLLHAHPELYHVEEELQEVLAVVSLHGMKVVSPSSDINFL